MKAAKRNQLLAQFKFAFSWHMAMPQSGYTLKSSFWSVAGTCRFRYFGHSFACIQTPVAWARSQLANSVTVVSPLSAQGDTGHLNVGGCFFAFDVSVLSVDQDHLGNKFWLTSVTTFRGLPARGRGRGWRGQMNALVRQKPPPQICYFPQYFGDVNAK